MMVQAITWKRSKILNWLHSLCQLSVLAAGLFWVLLPQLLVAKDAQENRVASVRQVAIMPVYWQGQFPESPVFSQSKKHIDTKFSELVRASKRFIFSNDVLTADHWASPDGRRQLAEDYEIDAFINLTVSGQGDMMLWTVRLLDPGMKNYLTETERMPFNWLSAATKVELDQRLQLLLFRMLNRYPVDVFVTSIQGRYLTLSSGSEQNIFENDQIKFYQTTIKAIHPIDGSWLGFEQKLLGEARVIESKKHSAIAEITSLSYPDAIRINDGARVDAIASRRAFQQVESKESLYVSIEPDNPIVEVRGQRNSAKISPVKPSNKNPEKHTLKAPPKSAEAEIENASNATAADSGEEAQDLTQEPIPAANPTTESGIGSEIGLPINFKEIKLQGEFENFKVQSAVAAANKFPEYLLNRLSLLAAQDVNSDVLALMSAHVSSGSTKKGSYFGFGLGIEPLYQIPIRSTDMPSLDKLLIGAMASLESLAVNGEKLGGWDALSLSPSLHLQGSYHAVDLIQTFDYDFAVRLLSYGIGEVGVGGKKRKINDTSGLEFNLNVVRRMKADEWEWGGLFAYQTAHWKLSTGAINREDLRIGLVGRMRL